MQYFVEVYTAANTHYLEPDLAEKITIQMLCETESNASQNVGNHLQQIFTPLSPKKDKGGLVARIGPLEKKDVSNITGPLQRLYSKISVKPTRL